MDQSLSFSSASFSSNHLLEEKYKLAYKQFINKNFEKSYRLINELYDSSFNEFSKGFISEVLFKKIINLYLTLVSLTISGQTLPFKLSQIDNHRLVNVFIQDTFLNKLTQAFGGSEINIPLDILYNYILVLITNKKVLIGNDDSFLNRVKSIYSSLIVNNSNSKYVKRFIDLYVFEVLPTFDNFDDARFIIESDAIYASDVKNQLDNLNKIEQNKLQIVEQQKQKEEERKKREQEYQKRELQKAKELEKQQNLQYKSIKDIQKEYATPISASSSSSDKQKVGLNKDTDVNRLNQLKEKLFYSYKLTKNYFKENSPIILVIVVLLFIINRFINLRQIKIKDKLLETIKMAFKVSYL
ncbi:hypothetical protein DFJ63DRAFT_310966 [Scheffersomyces coipomensis]|uniref:uncharacterized protein n=1 Tax=Scheffersomyces coipomensis TaxID=1788519 RepID=UPI00315D6843